VKLFEALEYVVVDEMHMYRGVFGSHMANVLRRLRRICQFYGSDPTFIFCSATIGNPGELARALVGDDIDLVDDNGAPSGERMVVLYNPPVVNRELGIRQSSLTTPRPTRPRTRRRLRNRAPHHDTPDRSEAACGRSPCAPRRCAPGRSRLISPEPATSVPARNGWASGFRVVSDRPQLPRKPSG
jgi:hypothetical protein